MLRTGLFAALLLQMTVWLHAEDSLNFFILPEEREIAFEKVQGAFLSARKEIVIMAFGFSHRELGNALKKKAKEGVKIDIIFDGKNNLESRYSQLGYLAKYRNITCLTTSRQGRERMHINAAVIDERLLVVTSANWSFSGFTKNDEYLLISDDPAQVQKFVRKAEGLIKAGAVY